MMMIALPTFASEILAALVAAVATLFAVRRPKVREYDVEREIARVTDKVRHPYTYRVREWLR